MNIPDFRKQLALYQKDIDRIDEERNRLDAEQSKWESFVDDIEDIITMYAEHIEGYSHVYIVSYYFKNDYVEACISETYDDHHTLKIDYAWFERWDTLYAVYVMEKENNAKAAKEAAKLEEDLKLYKELKARFEPQDDVQKFVDRELVWSDTERITRDYNEVHRCCPRCNCSFSVTITLAAYTANPNDPLSYIDKNAARCGVCGWEGIVHDLLP